MSDKNKITKIIILALTVTIAVFALYPHEAHAEGCNPFAFDAYQCTASIFANLAYIILLIVTRITYLCGLFFDYAVNFALGTGTATGEESTVSMIFNNPSSVVLQGWQICRDIANMFFLFALLYIGISTILKLSGSGYKKLLLGVIIAALLVNFSLPITKIIIDFSNVIAVEFLCKMTGNTCEATDLSGAIVNGLKTQTIFGSEDAGFLSESKLEIWSILIAIPLSVIVALITAFVLFAGGVLFLIRTVVLMILTILSPLAFLSMALPGKAGSYANKWWDYLFSQCFFAPVYLFFLYLVISMITPSPGGGPSFIMALTGSEHGDFNGAFTDDGTSTIATNDMGMILQFVIMIILLIMCLVTAQQLGAYGAGGMIKLGQKAKGKAIGYAGRGARRVAGKPAEAFATGKAPEGAGRFSRAMAAVGRGTQKYGRYIPGAGYAMQGVGGIAAANRAKVAEIQGGMDKNNDTELRSIAAASSGFRRTAALNLLAKREKLTPGQGLTSQHIKATPSYLRRYGMETEAKNIEKLNWQYAETPEERQAIVQKASPAIIRKIMEDEKLSASYSTPEIRRTMQESFRPEHYKAVYDSGTAAAHQFFQSLTEGSKSIEQMAQRLESLGTPNSQRSASWAQSSSARMIMETYLPPQPEKKESPEAPKEGTREFAEERWRTSKK